MKKFVMLNIIYIAIGIGILVGEVKCFIKMVQCNFDPIGKAEIIYSVSFFTGLGCVVGYLDIKDN